MRRPIARRTVGALLLVLVTASARDRAWDVMIAPSTTASVVLKADGTVDYYCKSHPNMIGQITIAK